MAEHQAPDEADSAERTVQGEGDDVLRKRLLSRVAVAGVAIVGLLGGLAVFDSLNRPGQSAMPPMASAPAEPVEEAKKPEAEKPLEAKAEEKAATEDTAKVDARETVPEKTETPIAAPGAEKPQKMAKAVTPPATARPAAIKPPEPVAAPAAKPDARREIARVMPESTRPPRTATAPDHAPPSRPLTQAAETARRFLVQVGVFSNHANAEELVGKLNEAGIPARIESHVQIGPFASRAEVDAARAKLKSLGMDDGMLVRR